jgi:hypothetical protein
MDWAACGSAQKPGSEVLDSKVPSAFSLPAMSKMLHDCGYPAAQFFYTVFLFNHYLSLSIFADTLARTYLSQSNRPLAAKCARRVGSGKRKPRQQFSTQLMELARSILCPIDIYNGFTDFLVLTAAPIISPLSVRSE